MDLTATFPNKPMAGKAPGFRARLASLIRHQGALVALVVLGAAAALRYESFLTPENLFNVLRQNSMAGLLALGMTFVILSGGIDLSVGALLAVGGVVGAAASAQGSAAAVAAGVAASTLLGLVNGLLVARARV